MRYPKEENSKAVDSQETQGIVRDSSGLYFARNPLLEDLERAAISQGLEFTEMLTNTEGVEYTGKCNSFSLLLHFYDLTFRLHSKKRAS